MATSVADEEELVSDHELEYDEQASIDESEDSGSEFQVSDEEVEDAEDSENEPINDKNLQEYAEALEEEGIDADEILLDVAVQESLESARHNRSVQQGASSSGAGSSKARNGSNAAAALRAAAAERRMAKKTKTGKDVDDEDFAEDSDAGDDDDDDEDVMSESDDELLVKSPAKAKGKGKGKAKAKAEKKEEPVKVMTVTEMRKRRRAAAREARAERKRWKGLTQVCSLRRRTIQPPLTWTKAEKNHIMLEQNHPELKDVWGDVERAIPVNVPVRDPQPPGLKVTLLPFQQESLHWFKKQEQGIWSGGMLADEMG